MATKKGGMPTGSGRGLSVDHIAEPLRPLAVPVGDLKFDPANARKHGERNIEAVKSSFARFGQRSPIVVQKNGMVVRAGNGRLQAAKELGWETIAAVVVDESSVDATAFAIADNRTGELAEWDDGTLAALLNELREEDFDIEEIGFDESELDELLAELEPEPTVGEDEAPEPPEEATSRPGQLWQLGRHRVLCGDSREHMEFGMHADLLFADPPYGMDLDTDFTREGGRVKGNRYERVVGDDAAFDASPFISDGPREQLWWGADYYRDTIPPGGSWVAWDKWCGKLEAVGNGLELCWSRRSHKRRVYQFLWSGFTARERNDRRSHPTQKPVALVARMVTDHAPSAASIYDPFLGSGTTLIAAEQLGRTCYGIEIDPRYVDVIIQRWENLTGEKAVLLSETDG